MSVIDDLRAAVTAVEDELMRVQDDLDAEQAQHAADNQAATARITALQLEVASLAADLEECENPTPEPEPEPEPEPLTHALLGLAAPTNLVEQRIAQAESLGGKIEAERIFSSSLTVPTQRIRDAIAAGRHPIVSFKPGTWANVANGQSDSALRVLATALQDFGAPLTVAFHHEPDQQSTPPDQGEGGSASDFARMQHRIIDVMKPLAPNLRFSVIMNGWWWTDQNRKFTDAQIEVWLPRSLRDKLDVIAADDYSPQTGEAGVVKTRNRVAWAKRVGGVKATGVGETNAFTATDLREQFAYCKSEPLIAWACVWDSTGDSYLPLSETGLDDDFAEITRDWR